MTSPTFIEAGKGGFVNKTLRLAAAALLIDLAGDYASIKVKPAAIAADLGGARVAVRLGYVF
jgi:hypothetical protein